MELNIHTCSSIINVSQVANTKHIIIYLFLQGKLCFLSCFPSFFFLEAIIINCMHGIFLCSLQCTFYFAIIFFNHTLFWKQIDDLLLLLLRQKYHLSHMIYLQSSLNRSHSLLFRNNNFWNINQRPLVYMWFCFLAFKVIVIKLSAVQPHQLMIAFSK